ncbi:MAG: hypothetical protein AAGI50_05305 [Pseudomonadota bacterium]
MTLTKISAHGAGGPGAAIMDAQRGVGLGRAASGGRCESLARHWSHNP